MDFQIHFSSYNRDTCERKISAAWFVKAESINEALRMGDLFLSGMKSAGCTDELIVAHIETRGLRGEQCCDGITIWETDDEREARHYASLDDEQLSAELDRLEKTAVKPGSQNDHFRSGRIERVKAEMRKRGGEVA